MLPNKPKITYYEISKGDALTFMYINTDVLINKLTEIETIALVEQFPCIPVTYLSHSV